MASQEDDSAGLLRSSVDSTLGSQETPECVNDSVYQPIDGLQDYQKGVLQALGAVQILSGALVLILGVFLCSLMLLTHLFRHVFFFTLYTGYPLWGAVSFIISGSLSVAAGRKPTRMLIQSSFGMNFASATNALVGIIFLLIHLALNNQSFKSCQSSQSPDLCIYLGSSSTGLVSLMLIFTFLEMGAAVSAMCCKGACSNSRQAISSPPNSVYS